MRRRVALLLPTASYRGAAFMAAAQALDLDVVAIGDYCHRLAPGWGFGPLQSVPFDDPRAAQEAVLAAWQGPAPDAVVAVDDHGVALAALLAERWGLRGNPATAVETLRDKFRFRQLLAETKLNTPRFARLANDAKPMLPADLNFPVVVKARRLSTSRAVIRADDPSSLARAVSLARRIQRSADRDADLLGLLIESFISGSEHALEAFIQGDRLIPLALFDKPDPLDGPYFEESLYVSPSRLPLTTQTHMAEATLAACRRAGIVSGPIHAEARVNTEGVWLLEIAPRSIGGLCGRVIEKFVGEPLEQLILRGALGDVTVSPRISGSVGVMMIPVPHTGLYEGCIGMEDALAIPGITDVAITAERGERLSPAPFGASYLGFIFAETASPEMTEWTLRAAHRCLKFSIRPAETLIALPGAHPA